VRHLTFKSIILLQGEDRTKLLKIYNFF